MAEEPADSLPEESEGDDDEELGFEGLDEDILPETPKVKSGFDPEDPSGILEDDEGEGEDDEEEEEEEDDDLDGINFSDLELSESNDDQPSMSRKATKQKVLSSDAESSPESENDEADQADNQEIPAEYWQVQRLIKYVKAGNPTATIIAMSSLRDFNLRDNYVQLAIKEAGGLEVLLNILETDENRCKIASLLVLREISSNPEISRNIYNMRGLETLIHTLRDPAKELKLLSAETIANISKIRKARRAMRKGDGISRLVDMLDFEQPGMFTGGADEETDFEVPRCGACALWSLAKSTKNKDAIRRAGAIPLIAKLLQTRQVSVVIPVVGILHECASEASFRLAIRTEGLLDYFVEGLKTPNHDLTQFCASAIYMCAEDPESRQIVYEKGAIDPLISIILDEHLRKNKPLLSAATGAIWKCASAIAKAGKYLEQGLVEMLVHLLDDEPENVLTNVAGAIEQIVMADPKNARLIKRAGAIPPLIGLLTINNPALLVNATKAVGQLAVDDEARREMDQQDGFRLVWSLLKHPNSSVQASAAWAICPYVESSKDSGDVVRNFVGGLEALVNLLKSDEMMVQAAVSQAVAVIATNDENLGIMSDHGVVQNLAKLAPTTDDQLRRCLASAIAECCNYKNNSTDFGRRKAVSPLCCYLTSEDTLVHRAAAKALAALSSDARNCITMHQCGVVPYLINMIGSLDNELQRAAAGVMHNIRKLALATEKVRLR
ncbi:Armadillo repeat-containing protein 4 [Orchesella cincta]|uniref:Armadillo repeat-containing protein 4 n=1 Tax=Orchesella cincta TaxID=48709 RepID=A0A1D2MZX6_ORCCI|nr:Armadillo repeat-containing protein 4 [Orchesella cincta]